MKRSIIALLTLALLIPFAIFSVCADTTPTFSVSDASAKPGEEFTVMVTCTDNPGITAWKLDIYYDNAALELTDCKMDCDFSSVLGSQTLDAMPYVISWSDDTKDVTTDGVMAELTFKVADTAESGDYTISLTYDEDNVYDLSETNIAFDIINGTVSVIKDTEPDDESSGTDTTTETDTSSVTETNPNNGDDTSSVESKEPVSKTESPTKNDDSTSKKSETPAQNNTESPASNGPSGETTTPSKNIPSATASKSAASKPSSSSAASSKSASSKAVSKNESKTSSISDTEVSSSEADVSLNTDTDSAVSESVSRVSSAVSSTVSSGKAGWKVAAVIIALAVIAGLAVLIVKKRGSAE